MTNRLAKEASPYLQQHAENPVDWYPWGEEALARARGEDRPILLSIGYSACHWCHVMERESFEDARTAKLMNDLFVNVKVDREERPDLDQIYQLVVQLMGRSGGWPLTVFLTPAQKPFFAGTYFPPADRYGMPSFAKVLTAVAEAYREKRGDIDAQADEIAGAIAEATRVEARASGAATGAAAAALTTDFVQRAARKIASRFDDANGGFGNAPKFPNTMALDVLLRAGDVARVKRALVAMRAGGIYDQLGGGFHRYSTDAQWLVPHFEKMLYDNALLLRLYVDGWRATGEETLAETARDVAAYVAREMTDPSTGGFYASQDADSEGEEGKFFVWSPEEIADALAGDDEAHGAATLAWGITEDGNFEETSKTVLSLVAPAAVSAAALARAREKLFAVREERVKPFRDEKILASWNGLMIGALADASRALDAPEMLAAAQRAFAFVESKLVTAEGRVLRLVKDDVVKGPGFLDDHAYVADAALDLYEATGDPRYVARARAIADALLRHFGGFYFTPDDGEALITRAKDPWDHAVPSGQAIACRVLLRLGALAEERYLEPARAELERLAGAALDNPMGIAQSVCLLDRLVRGSVDVVVVGRGVREDPRAHALVREVSRAWLGARNVAWLDPSDDASRAACAALAEGKTPASDGSPAAYVCRGRTCSLPLTTPESLREALAR